MRVFVRSTNAVHHPSTVDSLWVSAALLTPAQLRRGPRDRQLVTCLGEGSAPELPSA